MAPSNMLIETTRSAHRFCAVLILFALASCSPETIEMSDEGGADRVEYSAAEKRIASALSLGNQSILQEAETDYEKALLCDVAVESLTQQLRERNLMDQTQAKALKDVGAYFKRRIKLFAASRDSEQISADRDGFVSYVQDDSVRAQIAVGCLRQAIDTQ